MTQEEMIISYLMEYGEITPLDAYREFGTLRLSARIHDYRKCGYEIRTDYTTGLNRWGDKVVYATYRLKRKYEITYRDKENNKIGILQIDGYKKDEIEKVFYQNHLKEYYKIEKCEVVK